MKWVNIEFEKPLNSGEYKIKAISLFKHCKKCYYDAVSNHWTYNDGFWLPISLDLYVTHWCREYESNY